MLTETLGIPEGSSCLALGGMDLLRQTFRELLAWPSRCHRLGCCFLSVLALEQIPRQGCLGSQTRVTGERARQAT